MYLETLTQATNSLLKVFETWHDVLALAKAQTEICKEIKLKGIITIVLSESSEKENKSAIIGKFKEQRTFIMRY